MRIVLRIYSGGVFHLCVHTGQLVWVAWFGVWKYDRNQGRWPFFAIFQYRDDFEGVVHLQCFHLVCSIYFCLLMLTCQKSGVQVCDGCYTKWLQLNFEADMLLTAQFCPQETPMVMRSFDIPVDVTTVSLQDINSYSQHARLEHLIMSITDVTLIP